MAAAFLLALILGDIARVRFSLEGMSDFNLVGILALLVGGTARGLRSVKDPS